ncbi:MAG: tRNA (adenosine(37)-N6)-threonylcarbamoyltransferase complex dimerization subunit type 1 TsaB [Acidobacteria bacterium]|nr:tRNA (adenosine(37)-N6)-threonylcarbamoyltransferase complex dimerization subunit type 1 TsaB [Acidobacteriota bacterium]
MLVLAADTSGRNGSLALVEFHPGSARTVDLVALEGGTFSAQLIPEIAALLKKHHLAKSAISGFAVVSGPGSFTGLRVGLAAIKGLAEILRQPIAVVSRFEATASMADAQGAILVVLDAARGQVYVAAYRMEHGQALALNQQLLSLDELRARVEGSCLVTCDESLAQEFPRAILVAPPRADVIARVGYEKIERGETVSPESLDAAYLRASPAEINAPARGAQP